MADDYRMVMKAIPAAERRALMALTNRHGLVRLGLHLGLIAGCAGLNAWGGGVLGIVGMVGQGAAMCFLFCAMHEASHATAFRTKAINTAVTWLTGLILIIGPKWFFYFHTDHHRYTHDPERDPELETPKPETRGGYLWHLSGLPLWGAVIRTLARNAATGPRADYVPLAAQGAVRREARLMLAIYAAVIGAGLTFAPAALIQFWLLPIILGQPFLRLFLMAEHTGCPHDPDMLRNSRTIRTNPLVMLIAWNMPYHTAHHSLPAVPFHQLAAFNAHLEPHIMHRAEGYRQFHGETVRGFSA
ncbi:MAG: fatty acid desaturase [Candidatus Puniceispirillales bacterium]